MALRPRLPYPGSRHRDIPPHSDASAFGNPGARRHSRPLRGAAARASASRWPATLVAVHQPQQVLAVLALLEALGLAAHVVRGDEAHVERDLLRAGHLQVLPLLDRLDEGRGLQQSLVGASVEPDHPAAELLDVQLAEREVGAVDVGDLELAARRGPEPGGDLQHAVVVEVETGDRVVRARLFRLLLEPDRLAVRPELDDPVSLRVAHAVGEDRSARAAAGGALQDLGQVVAVEDVVAERERRPVRAHEIAPYQERLREPLRPRLRRPREPDPELRAVAEQALEAVL